MTSEAFDTLVNPVLDDLLTPETASRLMTFRVPNDTIRRLEVLRQRAQDGALGTDERREYEGLVDALDLIALIKLKAQRLSPNGG